LALATLASLRETSDRSALTGMSLAKTVHKGLDGMSDHGRALLELPGERRHVDDAPLFDDAIVGEAEERHAFDVRFLALARHAARRHRIRT
jgi:hypothetical protein